jgi:hypothetical protein
MVVKIHVFVKIVEPQPPRQPLPRLLVLDPANVRVRYQDDDIDEVYEYINTWNSLDERGKPVLHRQRTILQDNGLWLVVDEEARPSEYVPLWREVGRRVWPYPWSPMLDCQNLPLPNVYYGEPDLTPDVVAQRGPGYSITSYQFSNLSITNVCYQNFYAQSIYFQHLLTGDIDLRITIAYFL